MPTLSFSVYTSLVTKETQFNIELEINNNIAAFCRTAYSWLTSQWTKPTLNWLELNNHTIVFTAESELYPWVSIIDSASLLFIFVKLLWHNLYCKAL